MNKRPRILGMAMHRTRLGYTIIELLTSIVIFGILTTLVIANFHSGGLNDDLRFSADLLAGNFRRAQNLSTTGNTVQFGGQNVVPPGGFGISLPWVPPAGGTETQCRLLEDDDGDGTTNTNCYNRGFSIFADVAGEWVNHDNACSGSANERYDYDENGIPNSTCDQAVESGFVAFKPRVVIGKIVLSNWHPPADADINYFRPIDIVFKPPHPTPLIDGYSGTVQIELNHTQTRKCYTITLNAVSGQVSVRSGSIDHYCQLYVAPE